MTCFNVSNSFAYRFLMAVSQAMVWLQAESCSSHPKHRDSWLHATVSFVIGYVSSVWLGYAAVVYDWVQTKPEVVSIDYDYLGWWLLAYQIAMVGCRASIKGQEELYNQASTPYSRCV